MPRALAGKRSISPMTNWPFTTSAVKVLGDEALRTIARELVATVRNNVTSDWTLRENVRALLAATALCPLS